MSSWVEAGPDGTLGTTDPAAGPRRRLRPRRHRAPPLVAADGGHPGAGGRRGAKSSSARRPGRRASTTVSWPRPTSAKVDRLFALGGAQAIAALAYGTETMPRVNKIVGAGELFVTLAKRQVFGGVGIDGFDGPHGNGRHRRRDRQPGLGRRHLLAQAEHDVLAVAILLTPSRPWPSRCRQVARQLEGLSRSGDHRRLAGRSRRHVLTADLAEAVELANVSAGALCLLSPSRWALVGQIRNAGGIFVGEHSFEVLGDYVAGPSHVMPTEGSARYASPLSVADFVKRISLIAFTRRPACGLSAPAAVWPAARG